MEPLQIIGFIVCLWAMAFLVGFGVIIGAWAGVKAAAWAFGPVVKLTVAWSRPDDR